MKIDKVTQKNNQVWLTFRNKNGDYIGTLHIIKDEYLDEFLKYFNKDGDKHEQA